MRDIQREQINNPSGPVMREAVRDNAKLRPMSFSEQVNFKARQASGEVDKATKPIQAMGAAINQATPLGAARRVAQEVTGPESPKLAEFLNTAEAATGLIAGIPRRGAIPSSPSTRTIQSTPMPRGAKTGPQISSKSAPVNKASFSGEAFNNRVTQNIKKGMTTSEAKAEAAAALKRMSPPQQEVKVQGKPASDYVRQNTAKDRTSQDFKKGAEAGKSMREAASPPKEKPVNPAAKSVLPKNKPKEVPKKPQVVNSRSFASQDGSPKWEAYKSMTKEEKAAQRAKGKERNKAQSEAYKKRTKAGEVYGQTPPSTGDERARAYVKAEADRQANNEVRNSRVTKALLNDPERNAAGQRPDATFPKGSWEKGQAKWQKNNPEPALEYANKQFDEASNPDPGKPYFKGQPRKDVKNEKQFLGKAIKGLQAKVTSALEKGALKPNNPYKGSKDYKWGGGDEFHKPSREAVRNSGTNIIDPRGARIDRWDWNDQVESLRDDDPFTYERRVVQEGYGPQLTASAKKTKEDAAREHTHLEEHAKSVMATGKPPSPTRNSSKPLVRSGGIDPVKEKQQMQAYKDAQGTKRGQIARKAEEAKKAAKKAKEDALLKQAGISREGERNSQAGKKDQSFSRSYSKSAVKNEREVRVRKANQDSKAAFDGKRAAQEARARENKKMNEHEFEQHAKRGKEMRLATPSKSPKDGKKLPPRSSPQKTTDGFVGPIQKPSKPRIKAGESSRPSQGSSSSNRKRR